MSNCTYDFSAAAVNWATFASSVVSIVGIVGAFLLGIIQHFRQAASDIKTKGLETQQAHLIDRHTELHKKIDSLTPPPTANASSASIGGEDGEIVLQRDKKKSD